MEKVICCLQRRAVSSLRSPRSPCFASIPVASFSTSSPAHSRLMSRKYPKTIKDVPKHQLHMFEGKLEYEYPDGLEGYGVRNVGIKFANSGKFVVVPEMIPELVVPDLTDFPLKPYVSFKVPDVLEAELTARDLFDVLYGKKIKEDFEAGKLNEELADIQKRESSGQLKTHTYDREPPRMLISGEIPIV